MSHTPTLRRFTTRYSGIGLRGKATAVSLSRRSRIVSLLVAFLWMVGMTGMHPLPSMAQSPSAGSAVAGTKVLSDTQSTSPTSESAGLGIGQLMDLGPLEGDWFYITLGKLRGKVGNYNIKFSKSNELAFLTMDGLIRIQSEEVDLECEALSYEKDKHLQARYNVNVNLKKEGIKARCGLLVYDFPRNAIVLTVDPYVLQETPNGPLETYNIRSMTITLRGDGSVEDVSVEGLEDQQVIIQMAQPGQPPPIRKNDRATSPAVAQEISPEALRPGLLDRVTPTPKPNGK